MKKLATLGIAAAFAALAFTAATMPAQADGISFGFGSDFGWDGDDDTSFVVQIDPDDMDTDDDDDTAQEKHVSWCEDHFSTYDEDTDMYFYKQGKQKKCISPWS